MPAVPAAAPPAAAGPAIPAGPSLPVPEGFTPVSVAGSVVQLTPENTTIQIIGKHAPPRGGPNDPNARTIVFMKFTGEMDVDPATRLPKSAKAEIDATSLVAFDPRLTSHLKNPDFIDVEKFPAIKFTSTKIEPAGEPGKVNITGNLTLKDVTKEITIPATVTHDAGGVTVHGQLTMNRRDFNINHSNIDERTMTEMELTLAVGKKSVPPTGGRR
jgi:polyisoprenoid-binding protein YceI